MKFEHHKKPLGVIFFAICVATLGLFSCEDDEIVTPVDNSGGGCTGSYCELDMNKSPLDVVYLPKNNPETF